MLQDPTDESWSLQSKPKPSKAEGINYCYKLLRMMEDCLHIWSTRFSKLSYWKGHEPKMLLLPSVALTSINQLTACEIEHLLLWEMLSQRMAEDRQRAWKAGNETSALQLVRTNGDVNFLSRLQLYTYHQAVWPYEHICVKEDVILIVYHFLLTYLFPKKLCCSKCPF